MASHIKQEGNYPEPSTLQEYQDELLRVWGALLRLDAQAQRVLTDVKDSVVTLEKLVKTVETMRLTIELVAGKK